MQILGLTDELQQLTDAREVESPWPTGRKLRVRIRPTLDGAFQRWKEREGPRRRDLFGEVQKQALLLTQRRRKSGGVFGDDDELFEEALERTEAQAVRVTTGADLKEGIARHLVVGWEGVVDAEGREIPFSPEALLRLMETGSGESLLRIPQEWAYGGRLFGDALADWLYDEASAHGAFLVETAELAAKNSDGLPGGGAGSGQLEVEPNGGESAGA